ncbi:MAG: serine/threonine-protein kinase [Pseudomonadota bacterium]
MSRRLDAPLTIEKITEEHRFLLRTLLRQDLFGSEVSLSEAEKLLEPSLSLGFVDYCAFLKKTGYLNIDRTNNTVAVSDRGKNIADGLEDPGFHARLAAHFAPRLKRDDATRTSVSPGSPPPIPRREAVAAGALSENTGRLLSESEDVVMGRYVRYDAIGQGSLGTVYRGKNVVLGHAVALKEVRHVFEYVSYVPREEILRRLRREVMAQAGLVHPHILAIHDVDFDCTFPTLIMDYAQGGSLKERLFRRKTEDQGTLPIDIALRYLLQICYGLLYAHSEGVVHGNLKPENVLFDRMGNVKLTDFGVARVTEKDQSTTVPVYVGMGAPSYMAPEQLHSSAEVGTAADVYGLGILLYEMLTGQLPGRRSPMPSKLNPQAGETLDDLFDHMTRDEISDRYQSVSQVLDHIYQNFPPGSVVERGVLLLFEHDPLPPAELGGDEPAVEDKRDGADTALADNDEVLDLTRENTAIEN